MNPFADNANPTVAEIEAWNVHVIQHYRNLLGISTPIENNRRLYLLAFFSDMRKFTTHWDANYPGDLGSAYGPCVGMKPFNAHCGATFAPNCTDQAPYLMPGETCVTWSGGGAEGVFGGNLNWPWSIQLVRVLYNIVVGEGIYGHGGPFVSRPLVGFSYKKCNSKTFAVRVKWSGTNISPCP